MINNLQLFIGDTEVEFSSIPEILYNYKETDLTNPTAVLNSFSKTITLEGTPTNNQLFGHYWSVERSQDTSFDGSGVYFNASKKVPFVLYCNSVIYEQGYVKLDDVILKGKDIIYTITLYGGLGDFFYCLKTTDDGNEKKLSDLDYGVDLDFTINKDTVMSAWFSLYYGKDESWKDEWENIWGDLWGALDFIVYNEKWDVINFMPAYNGKPDDFDTNKVLINTSNTLIFGEKTSSGKTYTAKNNFVIGELPDEMTEWEVRDLRSYLQRPCIRMKKIVEACCKPENNGGYNVDLDKTFFNEENPYWEKTWLSLPMIQSLEYKNESQIIEDSKLLTGGFIEESNYQSYMYQDLYFGIGNFPEQTPSTITVKGTLNLKDFNRYSNYPYTSYILFGDETYTTNKKGFACFGSLFVQLLAFNNDTVVGASQAYNLTSPIRAGGKLFYGNNSRYEEDHKFKPYMNQTIYDSFGWNYQGFWCKENNTTPYEFSFTMRNINSPITSLRLCYFWGCSKDKRDRLGISGFFGADYYVKNHGTNYNGKLAQMENLYFESTDSTIKAVMGESIGRTGTQVTKDLLLNTEASPCDYLLSYCKMFGLHFRKDILEKKIYIETRDTFYQRNEIIDLTEDIDKSRDITIKPISFDTKWYEFKQEMDETDFQHRYFSSKGVNYGSKVLNTGYEFIADKKNLLDKNVIKSGIEGLEKSKYFTTLGVLDDTQRPWFQGMPYQLYNGNEVLDTNAQNYLGNTIFALNEGSGMKYYDLFPKLQFHDNDNGTTDGNNVLVFLSGFENVKTERILPLQYILSDDTPFQTILNEGSPCWLFTKDSYVTINGKTEHLAYQLENIPRFCRYYIDDKNGTTVKHSLDFGTPQELYTPNYSITDEVNIYHNYWRTYIEDLYNVDTRILTCYVDLKGKPSHELLRKFYWFDNAIWRLNKIVDWNVAKNETTKMEFVKVHDMENYIVIPSQPNSSINLTSSSYNIPKGGGEVTLNIVTSAKTDDGNTWRILNPQNGNTNSENNFVLLSRNSGIGNSNVGVTVSSNNRSEGRAIYLTAVNGDGATSNLTLYQGYNNETYFNVEPDNFIIGGETSKQDITFKWINQNYNVVDNYIDNGDIDVVGVTYGDKNNATINFNPNKDYWVKSESVTFTSGEYEDTIGIDQLPTLLEFDKNGTQIYTLSFKYNKPNFTDLPYWINILKVDDYEYKVMAKPNYYKQIQENTFKVNGVEMKVKQEEGEGVGGVQESTINPSSLYFDVDGGSQFLMINSQKSWTIEADNWISLSQKKGNGYAIVTVKVNRNEEVSRLSIMRVICEDKTINVTVTQTGAITNPTFYLNPSSATIGKEGGIIKVTFTYTDRDYVTIDGGETSVSDIEWMGWDGFVNVRVPENKTISTKIYEIVFTTSLGDYIFTITQDAGDSYISVSNLSLLFDNEGGTLKNVLNSNTEWSITYNADWFTVTPSTGNGNADLNITVNSNEVKTDRSSIVTATTIDGKKASFTINQRKFVPRLSVTPSSITFNSEGGTAKLLISSNTDWNIEL